METKNLIKVTKKLKRRKELLLHFSIRFYFFLNRIPFQICRYSIFKKGLHGALQSTAIVFQSFSPDEMLTIRHW